MNQHPATAQETAAEYLNAGLWQDGADVLVQMISSVADAATVHPMAYYYLAYFEGKLGQADKESECYRLAASVSPDYVFPFQSEAIDVLRTAIERNPKDARAPYYLGNVLYDWQPEEAVKAWQASAALDPSFAIVHRNLAIAYAHRKPQPDLKGAIAEMEKAVGVEHKYALHFAELDELYEQAGIPLEHRLPIFRQNAAVIAGRDDAQNRAIALKVATGEYDEAIRMMTGRQFAVAEGANLNVAEHWTDAHLLRARKQIEAKRYQEALGDLAAAMKVPSNLPLEGPGGAALRAAEAAYWTGVAYEGLGQHQKAVEAWHGAEPRAQSPARRRRPMGANPIAGSQPYYQALCLQKLGEVEKAKELFTALVEAGKSGLAGPERARTAAAHYLIGLGYLGLDDRAQAKSELSQAVQISPDLLGARVALAAL